MDYFGREQLRELFEINGSPAVSIYMKTHRRGSDVAAQPLRLRAALTEARRIIARDGLNGRGDVLGPVDSLDEGIDRANDTEYWLTAGVFAGTKEEVDRFFTRIQAGTTYANRRAGATTGAWPGIQSFGGWKGSGTTSTGFSQYYLRQYLKEQSRTVVE